MHTRDRERMKPGDFTNLADMYAKYRPGYTHTVLQAILGIANKPVNEIDFVDVGAGTGIWTRQVAMQNCRSVTAVEPNDAMRAEGNAGNHGLNIHWQEGAAEKTNLLSNSADILSMASSFHWANFDLATQEFHRVLKPNGHFVALWNPRYLENNPLLVEIEDYISHLEPSIKRVSSGKSKHVDELAKKMEMSPLFKNLTYVESKHTATLKVEEYIGAWKSVNDVRVQLGENKFELFLNFIMEKLQAYSTIDCTYQTRAWIMQRR